MVEIIITMSVGSNVKRNILVRYSVPRMNDKWTAHKILVKTFKIYIASVTSNKLCEQNFSDVNRRRNVFLFSKDFETEIKVNGNKSEV